MRWPCLPGWSGLTNPPLKIRVTAEKASDKVYCFMLFPIGLPQHYRLRPDAVEPSRFPGVTAAIQRFQPAFTPFFSSRIPARPAQPVFPTRFPKSFSQPGAKSQFTLLNISGERPSSTRLVRVVELLDSTFRRDFRCRIMTIPGAVTTLTPPPLP